MGQKVVKVHINASGKQLVGFLHLPPGTLRTSDLLDGPDTFLAVYPEDHIPPERTTAVQVVAKDAISYVETLDERTEARQTAPKGRFCSVVVELKEPQTQILGEIFLPSGSDLVEMLNDRRHFVNLRNVHFNNFVDRYTYLAISKKQIILLRT